VGHFVARYGELAGFIDPLVGETVAETAPLTYLLAHDSAVLHRHPFVQSSVVVDPWRRCPPIDGCQVVHYGSAVRTPGGQ